MACLVSANPQVTFVAKRGACFLLTACMRELLLGTMFVLALWDWTYRWSRPACAWSKVRTDPVSLGRALSKHAPEAVRIGIEAGGSSSWLCRELRSQGFGRSAYGIASCSSGTIDASQQDRSEQCARSGRADAGWLVQAGPCQIGRGTSHAFVAAGPKVDTRRNLQNQIRNIVKTSGAMPGSTCGRGFIRKVEDRCKKDAMLATMCFPMLEVISAICVQIKAYDRSLSRMARSDETVKRMMSVPGIGPLTALAFVSAIDDPHRFKRSSDVGVYLGLTPRRHQSGEMDLSGRISKRGDGLARTCLFEVAPVAIMRIDRWSTLKAWGLRLTKRVGSRKARIAVARELAVILHCIWVDGTEFEWTRPATAWGKEIEFRPFERIVRPGRWADDLVAIVTAKTARVTLRPRTDAAHGEAAHADLGKNDDPGARRSRIASKSRQTTAG